MARRALRWLRAEAAFVLVLAIVLTAVVYLLLDPGNWRPAAAIIAAGLALAAGFRLVLPAAHVGLLAVRGRWRDALFLLAVGAVILGVVVRLHTDGSTG
jgi:hypothetical protein